MEPVTKSFNELFAYLNVSKAQIIRELGIAKQTFDNILKGINLPSMGLIYKVLELYPEINPAWLITNKGDMLLSDVEKSNNECLKRIQYLEERLQTLSRLSQTQEFALELLKRQANIDVKTETDLND